LRERVAEGRERGARTNRPLSLTLSREGRGDSVRFPLEGASMKSTAPS
jgi:hypothetical protein